MRRPAPPGGTPPPASVPLPGAGAPLSLRPLAEEVARRHRAEFPDEAGRYGEAGAEWCVHDNQHILAWAAGAAAGYVDLERELGWLARVLESRDYPLARLARNLDHAAAVAGERAGAGGAELERRLLDGARFVRSRESFLV